MTSIRRHLLTRLLPGFFFLWVVAGTAVYQAIRSNLESELDAELREIARALPFGDPSTTSRSPLGIEDFASDDFGIYFEIWSDDGSRLLKSSNLGEFDLAPPTVFTPEGDFDDQVLGTGDPVRTLSLLESGPGNLAGLDLGIMVAITRDPLNRSLQRLLLGIVTVGLLGAFAFGGLATYALRVGLQPLVELGDQAALMDADSLNARFPTAELPRELLPIAEKLNRLMERLDRSFTRERRFSADLAHELRNPVAALRSIAEVARKWPERVSGDEFDDVQTISTELQTTIENMLTLARLEKEGDVETARVHLREMITEIWALHQDRATERSLKLRLDVPPETMVETEPRLLRVIVSNLVSNAIDYSPEGSSVTISELQEVGPVFTFANPAPWISKADLPHLFDRLWRHDQARSDSSHTGLGLSIARICAQKLGADLRADLGKEKDLVFRLAFGIG